MMIAQFRASKFIDLCVLGRSAMSLSGEVVWVCRGLHFKSECSGGKGLDWHGMHPCKQPIKQWLDENLAFAGQ